MVQKKNIKTKTRIVIVGAGLSGLSAALACAMAGYDILLLERNKKKQIGNKSDPRVTALTQSSMCMLNMLQVTQHLQHNPYPITEMNISSDLPRYTKLLTQMLSLGSSQEVGFIVENKYLLQALLTLVEAHPKIDIQYEAYIDSTDIDTESVEIVLESGQEITAELLVACDGRNSQLRASQNIAVVQHAYKQNAIIGCFTHQNPHKGRAYQYFGEKGLCALLPLSDYESAFVWVEEEETANAHILFGEDKFEECLQYHFGEVYGNITLGSKTKQPLTSFPLSLSLAESYVRPRFILLGEAAHVIHPLSGHGYNLTLRDAACLADAIFDANYLGLSLGNMSVFEGYNQQRRTDILLMGMITHGLKTLFTSSFPFSGLCKNTSLFLGRFFPTKYVLRYADKGLGEVPRLLRGDYYES